MTRSELDRLQIAAQNAAPIDPRMKIGSLFSGGGGGDLGFINAGHEIVDIANTNRYRICGNGIVATVTE